MYKINVPPLPNIKKVSIFYFREGGGSIFYFSPLNYKNLQTLQVLEIGSGHITLILSIDPSTHYNLGYFVVLY